MAQGRTYPLEFRAQLIELVQSGRTPGELSRESSPRRRRSETRSGRRIGA